MEFVLPRHAATRRRLRRVDVPAVAGWLLACAVVVGVGVSGGGYGELAHDQLAIAVWWVVLVGAATGAIATFGRTRGVVAVALLAALSGWIALSAGWSASAETTTQELMRNIGYLGVLVCGLAVAARTSPRHLLSGVATGAAAIALLAVLSRLHPAWFAANELNGFLPGGSKRLAYPVNYWNGLAAVAAIGAVLLLAQTTAARTITGQALSAAALPVCALTIYYAVSRDGVLALSAGVVVLVALAPDRLSRLATLALAGAGSALVLAAAAQRHALRTGVDSPLARHQGNSMLALMIVVCAGVALAQVAISLWTRHGARPQLRQPRMALAGAAVLALAIAIAADLPGTLTHAWHVFQRPGYIAPTADIFAKLQTTGGNGRYQLWQAAASAWHAHPWRGVGAGSYVFWWAQHGSQPLFVRDAHSLWMQSLAELGLVGTALVVALFALGIGSGVRSALRAASASRRLVAAAAVAGLVAFALDATFEWLWQLPAVTVIAMLLLAAALGGRVRRRLPAERLGLGLAAAAAIAVVAMPFAAATALHDSRAAAADGNLPSALRSARTAARLAASDAAPRLQVALVEERAGTLDAAAADAQRATVLAPQDWQPLLGLARIEAERGHTRAAIAAFGHARTLNPRSPLLSILQTW